MNAAFLQDETGRAHALAGMDDDIPAWAEGAWCANHDDREQHVSQEGQGGRAEKNILVVEVVARNLGSKSPDHGSNGGAARKPLGIRDLVAMFHGNGRRIEPYDPA